MPQRFQEHSERNVLIAKRYAEGATQREIASEFNITQQEVSHITRKPAMQDIIRRAHERFITNTLDVAVENIDYVVKGYKGTDDKQLRDHGYDASKKVLEAAGLLSSHAQSIVHQTYIAQQTNVMNPLINDLINKHFGGYALEKPVWELEAPAEGAVIEAEVKDVAVEKRCERASDIEKHTGNDESGVSTRPGSRRVLVKRRKR